MKLPNNVRKFRKERKLSQAELAKISEIKAGKSYISKLENNEPVISLKMIYRISKSLKANPSEIFLFDMLHS